jgi:hypothetical protein
MCGHGETLASFCEQACWWFAWAKRMVVVNFPELRIPRWGRTSRRLSRAGLRCNAEVGERLVAIPPDVHPHEPAVVISISCAVLWLISTPLILPRALRSWTLGSPSVVMQPRCPLG